MGGMKSEREGEKRCTYQYIRKTANMPPLEEEQQSELSLSPIDPISPDREPESGFESVADALDALERSNEPDTSTAPEVTDSSTAGNVPDGTTVGPGAASATASSTPESTPVPEVLAAPITTAKPAVRQRYTASQASPQPSPQKGKNSRDLDSGCVDRMLSCVW